jgi:hypothetical protein
MSCNATEPAVATLYALACRNLENYIHNTSHRDELMAVICYIFYKITLRPKKSVKKNHLDAQLILSILRPHLHFRRI